MFLLDIATPSFKATHDFGTLAAIGMALMLGSMVIISVLDYIDFRNYKMRRLH